VRNTTLKARGVTVTVDGKRWRLVPSLADSSSRDREFTAVQTAGGKTVVQFGDGIHGARPTVGSTITVRYRTGGGASGNPATVVLQTAAAEGTVDQTLWIAIRNRSHAISFECREGQGQSSARRKPRSRKT
jgi:hypothetical protein